MQVLESKLDQSVNFVEKLSDGGYFESRYVRRQPEYLTCYLSSHSGCVKGCKFCHLTSTGQTTFQHATMEDIKRQAEVVLAHSTKVGAPYARIVYFSFMARGEPLANSYLNSNGDRVLGELGELATHYGGLASRFCVSTIMPVEMRRQELTNIFQYHRPMFYYSLYSVNHEFRKRWMPQALEPKEALAKLGRWQNDTGMLVKIHGAVIAGQNSAWTVWAENLDAIKQAGLRPEINLVPYNPTDGGSESVSDSSMQKLAWYIREESGLQVQVKDRVGFDVKASCGMFVNQEPA